MSVFVNIFEFVQLLAFPLYELLHNFSFRQVTSELRKSGNSSGGVIDYVENFTQFVQSWLPQVDSIFLSTLQFLIAWWLTISALVLTLSVALLRRLAKSPKMQSRKGILSKVFASANNPTWILDLLPIVTLVYIPVFQTYFSTLSCLVDWSSNESVTSLTLSRRDRCLQVTEQPQLYTCLSISGFIVAYYIMTALRTSNEPKPLPGVISFTSRSEVVNKHGAIVLLLIYSIFSIRGIQSSEEKVPADPLVVVRGVLACLVLLFLILYNAAVGACYVLSVNCMKIVGYLFVFWTCVVVTFYTNPENAKFLRALDASAVWLVMLIGWAIIALCFTLVWQKYWKLKVIQEVVYVTELKASTTLAYTQWLPKLFRIKKKASNSQQPPDDDAVIKSPVRTTVIELHSPMNTSVTEPELPASSNRVTKKRVTYSRAPKSLPLPPASLRDLAKDLNSAEDT